jgi:hypothetical protein
MGPDCQGIGLVIDQQEGEAVETLLGGGGSVPARRLRNRPGVPASLAGLAPRTGSVTRKVDPRPVPALSPSTVPPCRCVSCWHDRQADAEATVAPGGRRILLLEAVEDVREELGLDALTVSVTLTCTSRRGPRARP